MIYVIGRWYNGKDGFIDEDRSLIRYTTDINKATAFANEDLNNMLKFLSHCTEDTKKDLRKKYHSVYIQTHEDDGRREYKETRITFEDFENKQKHFYVFNNEIKKAVAEVED